MKSGVRLIARLVLGVAAAVGVAVALTNSAVAPSQHEAR
jgi:hypothetical protein